MSFSPVQQVVQQKAVQGHGRHECGPSPRCRHTRRQRTGQQDVQLEQGLQKYGRLEQGHQKDGKLEQGLQRDGRLEQGPQKDGRLEQGLGKDGRLEQGQQQGGIQLELGQQRVVQEHGRHERG